MSYITCTGWSSSVASFPCFLVGGGTGRALDHIGFIDFSI